MLVKIYIDLQYIKTRDITRKVRKAVESYIENDELGIFKDIQQYWVGYIEGKDATPKTIGLPPSIHLVFDTFENRNEEIIAYEEIRELIRKATEEN